jgi:GT2 family glycosyltransferase
VSRPAVSVVMPFAGGVAAAYEALSALHRLETRAGDELILADNSGVAPSDPAVRVIKAGAERSPAHARNAGAEHAQGEWILFLDADCRAPRDLLDEYFAQPVADDVGALAGEVVPLGEGATVAERYGASRSFLSQRAHLAHPYLPRAVAANLIVRRAAFEQVGGFYEGVRAAEDTDFSWRLQRAGWRLELRPEAKVEHHYRATVRELRAQWRGYAAGRAWLRRRYEGFEPEPAVRRGLARGWARVRRRPEHGLGARRDPRAVARRPRSPDDGRLDRAQYLALDALLAVEELAGFALSNRPERSASEQPGGVILVADRFPVRGDPLVEFARTLEGARVEAGERPELPWVQAARELEISYREDDGAAARALALAWLTVRHPLRCTLDVVRRRPGQPGLSALAPAAIRLERERGARVHAVGGDDARATALRLAALAGRGLAEPRRP